MRVELLRKLVLPNIVVVIPGLAGLRLTLESSIWGGWRAGWAWERRLRSLDEGPALGGGVANRNESDIAALETFKRRELKKSAKPTQAAACYSTDLLF